MTTQKVDNLCSNCGEPGRKVSLKTLESLLHAEAKIRLYSANMFLFCRNPKCKVVYFGDDTFLTSDLCVSVFQKSAKPTRPVCYCFNYSVSDVEMDMRSAGTLTIAINIREKCKKGLANCERNNPQGVCCLGNIAKLVKEIQPGQTTYKDASCCSDEEQSKAL